MTTETKKPELKDIAKAEFKQFVKDLKEEGLEVAEDVAVKIFLKSNEMIKRIVLKTENKLDDLYLVIEGNVKEVALDLIDKIDRKEG